MLIDLTIDQVSQIVGVAKSKLRYWEKTFGVAVYRTNSGHRRYSQQMVAIFQRIKELDAYGFATRGIKAELEKKTPLGPFPSRKTLTGLL